MNAGDQYGSFVNLCVYAMNGDSVQLMAYSIRGTATLQGLDMKIVLNELWHR